MGDSHRQRCRPRSLRLAFFLHLIVSVLVYRFPPSISVISSREAFNRTHLSTTASLTTVSTGLPEGHRQLVTPAGRVRLSLSPCCEGFSSSSYLPPSVSSKLAVSYCYEKRSASTPVYNGRGPVYGVSPQGNLGQACRFSTTVSDRVLRCLSATNLFRLCAACFYRLRAVLLIRLRAASVTRCRARVPSEPEQNDYGDVALTRSSWFNAQDATTHHQFNSPTKEGQVLPPLTKNQPWKLFACAVHINGGTFCTSLGENPNSIRFVGHVFQMDFSLVGLGPCYELSDKGQIIAAKSGIVSQKLLEWLVGYGPEAILSFVISYVSYFLHVSNLWLKTHWVKAQV